MSESDKNFQFFIKSALEQSKINKINFINLKNDAILPYFILRDKQIIFHRYKILVIDKHLNYKKLVTQGRFSHVWITGNAKFKIEKLSKEI